jgi:hypothetical protein
VVNRKNTKTNAINSSSNTLNTRTTKTSTNSFQIHNISAIEHDSPDPPTSNKDNNITVTPPSKFTTKQHCKLHIHSTLHELAVADSLFLNQAITRAEDECTDMAKQTANNENHVSIEDAHKLQQHQPNLIQQGCNAGYRISMAFLRATQSIKPNTNQVRFLPITLFVLSILTTHLSSSLMIQVQMGTTSVKKTA